MEKDTLKSMTISHTGPKHDFRRQIAHANFPRNKVCILHSATENYINFESIYQRDNICDRMSDTRVEITDLSTGQVRNHDLSFSLGKKAYQQNFFF